MRPCAKGSPLPVRATPPPASDTGVAFELLQAALKGAASNAAINLESLQDTGFAAGADAEVQRLTRRWTRRSAEARQALGRP